MRYGVQIADLQIGTGVNKYKNMVLLKGRFIRKKLHEGVGFSAFFSTLRTLETN
jgi:hypothetical protein